MNDKLSTIFDSSVVLSFNKPYKFTLKQIFMVLCHNLKNCEFWTYFETFCPSLFTFIDLENLKLFCYFKLSF